MKWIIYFLLIFNIGFAAWHFRGLDMREDGANTAVDIHNENQLILLSEYRAQQKKQNQKKQNLKKVAGGKLCYSLGPFKNKTESEKIQALLKEQGTESKRIQLRDTSRQGFWVILPASESRKEANKKITRLKELKIKDYFLVATGTHENAISLGVFSQKNLARRRVDEIIRLGFVPRMETVALPRKVHWLNWYKDMQTQPDQSIIRNLQNQYPHLKQVERSCK